MPEVWLPPKMQGLIGGQDRVKVAGDTVRKVIDNLEEMYPGVKDELYFEEEDVLMPGISVVIDDQPSQLGILAHVNEDSEVHFLPALGGGV
jgi:molybdopterin synthase sulfur carrier subunit